MEQDKVCEECRTPMEFYQSHKERLEDEKVHDLEEYLCRPCRTFVTLNTGITTHD